MTIFFLFFIVTPLQYQKGNIYFFCRPSKQKKKKMIKCLNFFFFVIQSNIEIHLAYLLLQFDYCSSTIELQYKQHYQYGFGELLIYIQHLMLSSKLPIQILYCMDRQQLCNFFFFIFFCDISLPQELFSYQRFYINLFYCVIY